MTKGGLKQIHVNKTGFKPIIDMINCHQSVLSVLSFSSLMGFIIKLSVPNNCVEYLDIHNSSDFNIPVTNYILKIAVLSKYANEDLPLYNSYDKATETKKSFFEEAKIQQYIWKNSIKNGKPAICPSVANLTLLNNTQSLLFINILNAKFNHPVFDYLLQTIASTVTYELGIITMPSVEKSSTTKDLIENTNTTAKTKTVATVATVAISNVIAQIVRLFLELKVIHFDLHDANALQYMDSNNELKCVLIDFGRSSLINSGKKDKYIDTLQEKHELLNYSNMEYNNLMNINNINNINNFDIKSVFLKIANLVNDKNRILFAFSNSAEITMKWLTRAVTQEIYNKALNTLIEETTPTPNGITPETLNAISNHFVNFSKPVQSFYILIQPRSAAAASVAAAPVPVAVAIKTKNKKTKMKTKTVKVKRSVKAKVQSTRRIRGRVSSSSY